MRWPWRRREPRHRMPGNGHVVKERAERAKQDLRDTVDQWQQVDRLAREMRRALGGSR